MKITETELEELNHKLAREYSYLGLTNLPLYRVIWSHDVMEKRRCQFSNEGFKLLLPEVREVPKYRQWNDNRYVLEKCCFVPENNIELVEKTSYEPVWTFESKTGIPLPPRWDACTLIIAQINGNLQGYLGAKYRDELMTATPEEAKQILDKGLKEVEETLFGNETSTTDALAYREGVVVPHPQNDTIH